MQKIKISICGLILLIFSIPLTISLYCTQYSTVAIIALILSIANFIALSITKTMCYKLEGDLDPANIIKTERDDDLI